MSTCRFTQQQRQGVVASDISCDPQNGPFACRLFILLVGFSTTGDNTSQIRVNRIIINHGLSSGYDLDDVARVARTKYK
jgi:hypothetical protein